MITSSPEETYDLGSEFAIRLSPGSIICFYGDLGAGKTTCIKGICAGLGVTSHVTSPTFTLINEYNGRLPIYHFDFYRINSDSETLDLGLDEYFFGDGICLIEWPSVINSLVPKNRFEFHLKWDFSAAANVRTVKVFAS